MEGISGAKLKRTKFGYSIRRKYGTINIYTDLEKETVKDFSHKRVRLHEIPSFEGFWKRLLEKLRNPTLIKNWTVYSGYIGEDFFARKHSEFVIECILPTGNTLYIPKRDFEVIYNLWEDYKRFKVKRAELCRLSRFTKYVISIIHRFEELRWGIDMLEKDEFVKWIDASHDLLEIFEGRDDAYPLSRKWVNEWFSRGEFTVNSSDKQRIIDLISNLDLDIFEINDPKVQEIIKSQLMELLEKLTETQSNIGFAVSFYLFTWNIRRFKHYFDKKQSFSLVKYFEHIDEGLKELEDLIRFFRGKSLLSDDIYEKEVSEIFSKINEMLKNAGIGNNEPVGTIKLLHILAPSYFPLLDNPIAEQIGLKDKRSPIDIKLYIRWMHRLKNWLRKYEDVIGELETKYGCSILKLVDEGLYIMCSVNLRIRTSKLL